jgi:hypothetical protein
MYLTKFVDGRISIVPSRQSTTLLFLPRHLATYVVLEVSPTTSYEVQKVRTENKPTYSHCKKRMDDHV